MTSNLGDDSFKMVDERMEQHICWMVWPENCIPDEIWMQTEILGSFVGFKALLDRLIFCCLVVIV